MAYAFTARIGAPGGASFESVDISSKSFPGFQAAEITLSMDSLANSYSIEYAPNPSRKSQRPAFVEDEIYLYLDGDLLLGGYVEDVSEDLESGSLRLGFSGRSRAGDLVDSSCVIGQAPRWHKADVRRIVEDICSLFGVGVTMIGDTGEPIRHFAADRGETAGEAIRRAAVLRGLRAYTVGSGIVLARAGALESRTVLEENFNIKRAGRRHSHAQRFSEYRFRGQTKATDELTGLSAGNLRHVITDTAVVRYRPKDLRVDGHTKGDMGKVAVLERNRAAGASEKLYLTVDSPVMETGQSWRPNMRVPVRMPTLSIDTTMLIVSVRFSVRASSVDTVLELTRPEAFDEVDYPALGRGAAWE